jgi:hypothetical protein
MLKGQFVLAHMSGDQMPADHLTKLGNIKKHRAFTQQILGLTLLEKCNDSTTQVSHPTPFQKNETVANGHSCTPYAIMLQFQRVYGLSIWLELSHPFNSLTRDKDLHTFPKITRCHHNRSMQPFQTFFEILLSYVRADAYNGDVI